MAAWPLFRGERHTRWHATIDPAPTAETRPVILAKNCARSEPEPVPQPDDAVPGRRNAARRARTSAVMGLLLVDLSNRDAEGNANRREGARLGPGRS
jgi:hypothetical protein